MQFPATEVQLYGEENLQSAIDRYNSGVDDFVSAVVVNRSLNTENFQAIINQVSNSKPFLFIGDECHHHSSASYSSSLPRNAEFRIGLSATPEHYLDEERNISSQIITARLLQIIHLLMQSKMKF